METPDNIRQRDVLGLNAITDKNLKTQTQILRSVFSLGMILSDNLVVHNV